MKRRIIKQKSAYTITLPIEWIRDHHLNAKDEIELNEEADGLLIRTQKQPELHTISLTLERGTSEYYRIIVENYYLKGVDILDLKLNDAHTFPIIQRIVSNLIGFEIVEHKNNFCKIAATAQPSAEQFNTLLQRSLNIITYTQELVQEDIKKLSFPRLSEIETQSNDVRRFLLFCTRTLHKTSITNRKEESFLHLLLERLILIEHNHYYLYQKISKIKKPKAREEVKKLYFRVCSLFLLFKEMFFKKDSRHFAKINKEWEEIYFKEGHELFEKCTKEESIIIYHSMYLSKLLFLISQPNLTTQAVN